MKPLFWPGRHALPCLLTLAVAGPVAGETIIDGGNIGGARWSPAGNPYFIRGDVTVPLGTTLTIDPGVIVEFNDRDLAMAGADTLRVELIVNGTLVVNGSAGAGTVTFRARSGTSTGIWYGIRLVDVLVPVPPPPEPPPPQPPPAYAVLDGAVIKNATVGILSQTRSPLHFRGLTLEANRIGVQTGSGTTDLDQVAATANGIAVYFRGPGTLTRSSLTSSFRGTTNYVGDGAGLFASPLSQQPVRVSDTTFDRNYYNIYLINGAVDLVNSILTNGQYGLLANGASVVPVHVTNCTFDGNYYNLYHSTGRVDLTSSILTNGHYGAVTMADSLPTITYSDIWNNSSANYVNAIAGAGVVSVDPLYVSTTDRHLQSSSPCIDSGVGPSVTPTVPDHDLDARSRPLNGNGIVDADGSEYDMGAYEFPAMSTGGSGGLGGSGGIAGAGGVGGSAGVGGVGGAAGNSASGGSSAGAGGMSGNSGRAGAGGGAGLGDGGAGAGGATGAGAGGVSGEGGDGGGEGGDAGTTSAGNGGAGGGGNAAGAGASGGGGAAAAGASGNGGHPSSNGENRSDPDNSGSCSCRAVGSAGSRAGNAGAPALFISLLLPLLARRRRRRPSTVSE